MDNTYLPAEFIKRLERIITDKEKLALTIDSFREKKPLTIRVNTLKTSAKETESYLSLNKINYKKILWYDNAFILEGTESNKITELPIYKEGKIYIQSLSSLIPSLVLDPSENDRVLDMAAAPGSKASHLAMIMDNKGMIVANDISQERLYKLKANIKQLGINNIKIEQRAGQSLWQKYTEYFDKVLVDVPCSMEGRFFTEDNKSYSHWSVKKIKNLAKLQCWMLRSALSATKVGGVIVYSTCTLAPEENEGVIDWLIKKEKGSIEIEDFNINNLELSKGLTLWGNKTYDLDASRTRRILPDKFMEGFFIAKIRKTKSNV